MERLQGPPRLPRQFKIYMPCFPIERPIADRLQGPLRPRPAVTTTSFSDRYPAAEMAQNPSRPPATSRPLRLFSDRYTRQRGCDEASHDPVVSSRPLRLFLRSGIRHRRWHRTRHDRLVNSRPLRFLLRSGTQQRDVAEPSTTASSAQDLYASFSDQVPGSGDGAAATTSSGEQPQLRLSDTVDQSNLANVFTLRRRPGIPSQPAVRHASRIDTNRRVFRAGKTVVGWDDSALRPSAERRGHSARRRGRSTGQDRKTPTRR